MKKWLTRICITMLISLPFSLQAAIEANRFQTAEQEQQYNQLVHELRCLVCQNQNLADSNAELAQDLRHQVYQMIQNGADDTEIIDYMVNRYGDFVLYRPPFKSSTYLLWTGPFLLILLAFFFLIKFIRQHESNKTVEISSEERNKLDVLLKPTDKTDKTRGDE